MITITQPDDWHLHLRDGPVLATTVAHSARCFGRAIVMPNLSLPVTTTAMALEYRQRILRALPSGTTFEPLMTLYLTDNSSTHEIERAQRSGCVVAAKLYPAGATTNSDAGVTQIAKLYPVLEVMERCGMPLLVHGESTDAHVDIFDREREFIERTLIGLMERFPGLRIVFEHVTTADAVNFVRAAADNLVATITAHHLLLNRNDMLVGGIRPHYYCLPILKSEYHRKALVSAATSGNPKFFLGSDSAPHSQRNKENRCGCAGIYTAHAAIELYAEAFEQAGALDKLEGFASFYGADFYRLPRNEAKITLTRKEWPVATSFALGTDALIPFRAGETVKWSFSV
ncbi:MAG: dihydroorotase [Gammaproteobacteria bacterium]|nr:dihydroorotase [Gammaproteobacteria bacterium]